MSTSLFNFGPLPNAELIARVLQHTKAINEAYLDALDAQKIKAAAEHKAGDAARDSHHEDSHAPSSAGSQTTSDHDHHRGVLA